MDERMAEWNKCTDPQCRECVEFRVIYGVSVVGELIDVGRSVGRFETEWKDQVDQVDQVDAHTARRSVSIPAANYRYREHS